MSSFIIEEKITYSIIVEEEFLPVEGNAINSGDSDLDKLIEDKIKERLKKGDIWAWCVVSVFASYGVYQASDIAEKMSFENEKEFCESWYFEDMKAAARMLLV
jgi:hypothetical protein